jgi:hypothetical protein
MIIFGRVEGRGSDLILVVSGMDEFVERSLDLEN